MDMKERVLEIVNNCFRMKKEFTTFQEIRK